MSESTKGLRVLKLINNDELIGIVEDGAQQIGDDDYTYDNLLFITNPMKVVTEYDKVNKVHALYLIDWIPSIRESIFPIDKQKVLTLGDPNPDLEKHYVDLVMAEKLFQAIQKARGANLGGHDDGEDGASNESGQDSEDTLTNKLKKHKFEDDDIQ